jgi:hypothetical protein
MFDPSPNKRPEAAGDQSDKAVQYAAMFELFDQHHEQDDEPENLNNGHRSGDY